MVRLHTSGGALLQQQAGALGAALQQAAAGAVGAPIASQQQEFGTLADRCVRSLSSKGSRKCSSCWGCIGPGCGRRAFARASTWCCWAITRSTQPHLALMPPFPHTHTLCMHAPLSSSPTYHLQKPVLLVTPP